MDGLETEPPAEHDNARVRAGAGYIAKRQRIDVRIGVGKIRFVPSVDGVGADRKLVTFAKAQPLQDIQIELLQQKWF